MKTPIDSFENVTPVILSSTCTISRNSTGIPDSGQLSYPFRKAIIIDEIRFNLRRRIGAANTNLGGQVAMTMQLGRHFVAKDYVPIWLLGTVMDRAQEEVIDNSITPNQAFSQYRWRLPEPLYVDAGQVLSASFARGIPAGLVDDASAFDVTLEVTYVGRTVAPSQPRPKLIAVPYVARFCTDLSNTYQQSNENHLFNMFDRSLQIQRLTGRVGGGSGVLSEMQALTPNAATGTNSLLTVKMTDSWGGKMVNDNTGPSDIFDIIRGAWTCDTEMPAKGQYKVQAMNLDTVNGQVLHVGMVGVRAEELR